jgi:hypothetical protein
MIPPMRQAIGQLQPGAVGVALSPVPIIAVILMLGTRRARSRGQRAEHALTSVKDLMAENDATIMFVLFLRYEDPRRRHRRFVNA